MEAPVRVIREYPRPELSLQIQGVKLTAATRMSRKLATEKVNHVELGRILLTKLTFLVEKCSNYDPKAVKGFSFSNLFKSVMQIQGTCWLNCEKLPMSTSNSVFRKSFFKNKFETARNCSKILFQLVIQANFYARDVEGQKCVFQVRLKPSEVRIPEGNQSYMIVNDAQNARPYGICLKNTVTNRRK